MALALEVGADVPFFLHRQPALATGVGERLQPVAGLVPQKVVLVSPGYPVSTGRVFRNLNLALTKGEKKPKSCLLNAQKIDIKRYLHNDLETVTLAMHPDIAHIKSRLADCGAIGALMSGSGPTVFGLFENDQSAASAYQRLLNEHLGRVFLVDMPV
jgi:4-diphosphocytidyl-2-C-methyl-D-erythritol kinase